MKAPACVLCVLFLAGCSYLPAGKECAFVEAQLKSVDGIQGMWVECPAGVFASDGITATIQFPDEGALRFERLGFNAFGPTAVNIVVAEAGGLVPRVASCSAIGPANFHRESPLGHHFHPTLIDVNEAVTRYREVLEEVQYWPQCPQYWEVQDKRGENYRYCARKQDAAEEPPKPDTCP